MMGVLLRSVKNVYRRRLRSVIVTAILALSLGIFLSMAQANAGTASISNSLKQEFGNLVVIRAAGLTEMALVQSSLQNQR